MIPLEKLRAVTHVVTHANCPDGVASAVVLKDALPDVRVSFMAYGEKAHRELAAEPGLIFCDFTPIRERVAEFVAAGAICLDHHPTAKDIVEAFGENGVFGLNEKNECGAWLAYTEVWVPLYDREAMGETDDVRLFASLAAIRDTWKKGDPSWKKACEQAATLMFWGFDAMARKSAFDGMVLLLEDLEQEHSLGAHLLEKQLDAARKAISEAYSFTTSKGTRVLMFQGVSATSDAAEMLDGEIPSPSFPTLGINIVAGFHYKLDDGKLQLQFSTRSHTGYDVGAFAKSKPGGGGHKAAAGFTVEVSPEVSTNPYAVFRLLLEEWEGGR